MGGIPRAPARGTEGERGLSLALRGFSSFVFKETTKYSMYLKIPKRDLHN